MDAETKTQRANVVKTNSKTHPSQYESKRNKRLNSILVGIRDQGNTATIKQDPLLGAEPSTEDFTATLSAMFSFDADRVRRGD